MAKSKLTRQERIDKNKLNPVTKEWEGLLQQEKKGNLNKTSSRNIEIIDTNYKIINDKGKIKKIQAKVHFDNTGHPDWYEEIKDYEVINDDEGHIIPKPIVGDRVMLK